MTAYTPRMVQPQIGETYWAADCPDTGNILLLDEAVERQVKHDFFSCHHCGKAHSIAVGDQYKHLWVGEPGNK